MSWIHFVLPRGTERNGPTWCGHALPSWEISSWKKRLNRRAHREHQAFCQKLFRQNERECPIVVRPSRLHILQARCLHHKEAFARRRTFTPARRWQTGGTGASRPCHDRATAVFGIAQVLLESLFPLFCRFRTTRSEGREKARRAQNTVKDLFCVFCAFLRLIFNWRPVFGFNVIIGVY